MSINSKSISTDLDNLTPLLGKKSLLDKIGENVSINGYIVNFRETSWGGFALVQTSSDIIQVVVNQIEKADKFKKGNWVEVNGLVKEKRSKKNTDIDVEISCNTVSVLSTPVIESPIEMSLPFIESNQNIVLDEAIVSLRHRLRRAVFQIQSEIVHNFRSFLKSQGFTEIFSPKIVGGNAEGGANVFALDYYGEDAFLAQSPQFYKQYTANAFGRVFEVGPVFRAEPSRTSRHLATYTSMDYEMSGIHSFEDIMSVEAVLLNEIISKVRENCYEALKIVNEAKRALGEVEPMEMPDTNIDIPQIRFHDAKDLIAKNFGKVSDNPDDLEPEDERLIAQLVKEETGSDFVFVTHYPIAKRPFYTMPDYENPNLTNSFDLLFRGLEITTGGQRIHQYDQQVDMLQKKGLNPDHFSEFLKLHQYGASPHGGLAIGLERLTMQILGLDNIREATLFPRDTQRLNP